MDTPKPPNCGRNGPYPSPVATGPRPIPRLPACPYLLAVNFQLVVPAISVLFGSTRRVKLRYRSSSAGPLQFDLPACGLKQRCL